MEVRLASEDGIAVVTLAAPQRRNALTTAMADDLIAALDELDRDDSVAVAVITGEGPGFCAGADLSTLARTGTDPLADANYTGLSTIYRSFHRFGTLAVPTIAAVHGAAVGAGLNLALAADLRVVATDARLMSGFLRIGAHPGGGHFHLLRRYLSRDAITALALFGEELDGADAVRLGLAWRAVPATDVLATAVDFARRVAGMPELARAVIASQRAELEVGFAWDGAIQLERAPQMRSFWLRDHAQA